VSAAPIPDDVTRLLWDMDLSTFDVDRDRAILFERVMSRGNWASMQWLRAHFDRDALRAFVQARGAAVLSPRDLAYWSAVCGLESPSEAGGGRPRWADG